jgi:nitrous oxide reductase accessory protein NosL
LRLRLRFRNLLKPKNKAMKKLLAIVTITSFLAACNNKTEESSSTTTTKDTAVTDSPLMDAMNTEDSVNKKIQDSTGKMMDTVIKK